MARLVSSRGARPLAHVWLLHSGDASKRSMGPIDLFSRARSTSSTLLVTTCASGKLTAYVAVAMGSTSMPPTMVAPAARAPALLPPAPQKRSRVRTTSGKWARGFVGGRVGACRAGGRRNHIGLRSFHHHRSFLDRLHQLRFVFVEPPAHIGFVG